jgi:hypothetical protein
MSPAEQAAARRDAARAYREAVKAKRDQAKMSLSSEVARRHPRTAFQISKALQPKVKVQSIFSVKADVAKIREGSKERARFENDFKSSMATIISAGGLHSVSTDDIVITKIYGTTEQTASTTRRQLQTSSSLLHIEFDVLADATANTALSTAVTAAKSTTTPVVLTVGESQVSTVPSSAMTSPTTAMTADIDCQYTWTDCRITCTRDFIRTTAPSGAGRACPDDSEAPPCYQLEGECDLNSKTEAFRHGIERNKVFHRDMEIFGAVICVKASAESSMRYICKIDGQD